MTTMVLIGGLTIGVIVLHLVVTGHLFLPSVLVAVTGIICCIYWVFSDSVMWGVTGLFLSALGGILVAWITIDAYPWAKTPITGKSERQ